MADYNPYLLEATEANHEVNPVMYTTQMLYDYETMGSIYKIIEDENMSLEDCPPPPTWTGIKSPRYKGEQHATHKKS